MPEDKKATENKGPGKVKFERTTVGEAKAQLNAQPESSNYVWGTRINSGTKADFRSYLNTQNDKDELVWGT